MITIYRSERRTDINIQIRNSHLPTVKLTYREGQKKKKWEWVWEKGGRDLPPVISMSYNHHEFSFPSSLQYVFFHVIFSLSLSLSSSPLLLFRLSFRSAEIWWADFRIFGSNLHLYPLRPSWDYRSQHRPASDTWELLQKKKVLRLWLTEKKRGDRAVRLEEGGRGVTGRGMEVQWD